MLRDGCQGLKKDYPSSLTAGRPDTAHLRSSLHFSRSIFVDGNRGKNPPFCISFPSLSLVKSEVNGAALEVVHAVQPNKVLQFDYLFFGGSKDRAKYALAVMDDL